MDSFEARPRGFKEREPTPTEPQESSHMEEGGPAVIQENNIFKITLDGSHFLEVQPRLAKLMRLALRTQARLDADPLSLNREFQTLTDVVSGMNCHKTTLFLRGDIPFDKLKENVVVEAEHNGHPEIISLANENPEQIFLFTDEVRDFAREHKSDFPFSVHVLALKGNTLVPAHSMLWLGEDAAGNEVCFHKEGPYIDMPFELTTLKSALDPYENVASAYLILPIADETTGKEQPAD